MNPITQQLKRFADDERAVSPVVGFVLMFALIMIVFTIYQAEVVPAQNAEVEFKHSQAVEAEMSQLNDAIQQAGTSGVPQSATIATGVQYPNRAFAINPGAPAGTLETVDAEVTISGLSGGNGYWSTVPPFDTALVMYHSNYNILQQETTYTLENGMFVKNFENDNNLLESNGSMISNEGQRINLVLVGGDFQESAMTTSVTVTPVSTSTEYLHLESDSSGAITVPTTLSKNQWVEILDGKEYVSLGGFSTGTVNTTTIALDQDETYEIRISKVSLGSADPPELAYLTSEDPRNPDETTIEATVDETESFTVSARDEFGNPVAGADVTVTVSTGDETRTLDTLDETGDDGRMTFSYTPNNNEVGAVTVEAKLDDGSGDTDLDTVTYDVEVSEDENGRDGGIGEIANGYDVEIIITSVSQDNGNNEPIEIEFENRGDGKATAKQVRVSGFFIQGSVESGGNSITFEETEITFNGDLVSLDDNEYEIGAGETVLTELEPESNQGGFLIMDIVYELEDGSIETGTYAVTIPG